LAVPCSSITSAAPRNRASCRRFSALQWVAEIAPVVRQQQPFAWAGAFDAVLP
jgi:hypothetical protein